MAGLPWEFKCKGLIVINVQGRCREEVRELLSFQQYFGSRESHLLHEIAIWQDAWSNTKIVTKGILEST